MGDKKNAKIAYKSHNRSCSVEVFWYNCLSETKDSQCISYMFNMR